MQLSQADKKKFKAFRIINNYGTRMSLSQDVKLMARDLVNQILDSGEMSGKNLTNLIASILYISAKMCRNPRPLKELCGAMCVKRKEVSRMYSEIHRLKARGKIQIKHIHNGPSADQSDAELFAVKFARFLELPHKAVNAISQMAKNMHKLEIMHSHQPSTVAACIIWAIIKTKPNDEKINIDASQVAQTCQVSERNFQTKFRSTVYPRLLDLIPSDYATKEEIAAVMI